MIDAVRAGGKPLLSVCPVCHSQLDVEKTARGTTYICRSCGGLEIKFRPRGNREEVR